MVSRHDEYLKFERVEAKLSERPDLHAFLILDRLSPAKFPKEDIVSSSEHDEIWLSVDPKIVAANATTKDLVDLVRCGVAYDDDIESFSLFT